MTVRVAAALLILLPACASCLASPIGAVTGPFASQVLAQQRQIAARDNAAPPKPDQTDASCRPSQERGTTNGRPDGSAQPHCRAPASEEFASRNRSVDPLPDPDRKPAAN